ncbi:hypothetical protein ACH5RR_025075 [Cinchona calisaya]|uniref:Uncharacterized protein n=1 Tax=Cinchona calisaya TaxID=153742 RepID=A0ABD2YZA8_9GENT
MSEENREMRTTLLDKIYSNWLDEVSAAKGKKKEDVESFLNEAHHVKRLKEDGWITDIKKYSGFRRWTPGLTGYKDQIAVIRASGSIRCTRGRFSGHGSQIISEEIIEKLHTARVSERFKAVIICINSPGGDALASDL